MYTGGESQYGKIIITSAGQTMTFPWKEDESGYVSYEDKLIFSTIHRPGVHSDMNYNDYEKEQILAINPLFHCELDYEFIDKFEDMLFYEFQNMVTVLFSSGEGEVLIRNMISHFRNGKGTDYRNGILNKMAQNHESVTTFRDKLIKIIKYELYKANGNLDILDTEELNFYIQKTANLPRFNTSSDTIKGLRIAVNDVWGNDVFIKKYRKKEGRYKGILYLRLFDHFGLDQPDVEKSFVGLAGFRAWFVLQHYKAFNGKFRPFIDYMEIEFEFEGDSNSKAYLSVGEEIKQLKK